MRHIFRSFVSITACSVTLAGCFSVPRASDNGLCKALDEFAQSISDDKPHAVTLMNNLARVDSDAVWGVACRRDDSPSAVMLCKYLSEHSSFEFMSANIEDALSCLGIRWSQQDNPVYFESFKGTVKTDHPMFTKADIHFELEFDDSKKDELPELTFSFQRKLKKD